MDASQDNKPNQPGMLGTGEYRARLMTKLNCLIAVLEVAIGKITRSIDLPGANEERLLKIRSNLENTLAICHRARSTLEKSGPSRPLAARDTALGKMTARDYVELSSIDEYRKFKQLEAIRREDLSAVDFDELARRLTDG